MFGNQRLPAGDYSIFAAVPHHPRRHMVAHTWSPPVVAYEGINT